MEDSIKNDSKGTLHVVATPIGNLEDITLRALRVLREADLIVCEDTRIVKKILFKYEIEGKSLLAISQHAPEEKVQRIMAALGEGKNVALVSDAGTPGLSDPGNEVVAEAVKLGFAVSPIPGASALAAIVSIAGINLQEFLFKGFPPHKKGRQTYFTQVAQSDIPVIYYDSPHRVLKNLEMLRELNVEKQVIIGRELTKMFEEIMRGPVGEVLEYFQSRPGKVKGEFVIIAYS